MIDTDTTLHIIMTPSKNIYVCQGLKFAGSIQKIFEDILHEECRMLQATGDVMYFDDGRLIVDPSEVVTVDIDGHRISFYIQDFSSLMFSLKMALDSSFGSEAVFVHSHIRNIVLSKEIAISLKDFLDAKYSTYKNREDEWFKTFGNDLSKIAAIGSDIIKKETIN